MSKRKYKIYFENMISDNFELFASFEKLHEKYASDQENLQSEFNEKGEKILEVVREYERRLCTNTERGIYNKFSTNLAEKFQNEIRKKYPFIDHVGLVVEKFSIKKINF